MTKIWTKPSFYLSSFVACAIMALTAGCASGGFKLTRQYARWVNSQNIILRIVIYILTSVVFAVTMLIDFVIFNTLDFWNGTVAAGSYEFKDGDKVFQVKHEFLPGTQLRKSTIQVMGSDQKLLQEVVLSETNQGQIEMFVDGKLKTRVDEISKIPMITYFDHQGQQTGEKTMLILPVATQNAAR
jgi:hypothetical protein